MASIGNLTNTFLRASQETTITLANLNFNFSIIKFIAPKEYQGLGDSFSRRWKVAAEDGAINIIAKKLSTLFSGINLNVPNLIRIYRLRTSEVAKLPAVNPKATSGISIFANYLNANSTSI